MVNSRKILIYKENAIKNIQEKYKILDDRYLRLELSNLIDNILCESSRVIKKKIDKKRLYDE